MFGLTYRSSGQPHGLHSRETGSVTSLPWFATDLLKDQRPERGADRPSHRGRALNSVWMLPCWAERHIRTPWRNLVGPERNQGNGMSWMNVRALLHWTVCAALLAATLICPA